MPILVLPVEGHGRRWVTPPNGILRRRTNLGAARGAIGVKDVPAVECDSRPGPCPEGGVTTGNLPDQSCFCSSRRRVCMRISAVGWVEKYSPRLAGSVDRLSSASRTSS